MDDRFFERERGQERARSTRRLPEIDINNWNISRTEPEDSDEEPLTWAPVMIIDDSPAVRRVVELSLGRMGIPTISFQDGLSALRALYNHEVAPPRVLLLDIGMPRMSGYDVAKRLHDNPAFAGTRILMLSGHDGIINRTRARMVGASGFIGKPFRSAELTHQVWLALQEQDEPADSLEQW